MPNWPASRFQCWSARAPLSHTSPVIATTTSLSCPRQCAFPGFAFPDPYPSSQKTFSRPFSGFWLSSTLVQQSTWRPHRAWGQGNLLHHASSQTRNDLLVVPLVGHWRIRTSGTNARAPTFRKGSCSTGILGSPFASRRILLVAAYNFLLWDLHVEKPSWHPTSRSYAQHHPDGCHWGKNFVEVHTLLLLKALHHNSGFEPA